MTTIERIHAREILDSRGRTTVEATVVLAGGASGTWRRASSRPTARTSSGSPAARAAQRTSSSRSTSAGHRIQLVGDDVFVTDEALLARGIAEGVTNAVLVKLTRSGP